MESQLAGIQFQNFLVKESHIVFRESGQQKISIGFEPSGFILKSLNQFQLELGVTITEEEEKFSINLQTVSVFSYPADADLEDYKQSLFIVNAPAIVFPYLRAYINSLTALSGMPPLVLPTLNLSPIGESLRGNIEEVEG